MSRVQYRQVVDLLVDRVPAGSVTTYGEVSLWVYGNGRSAPAIVSMLNAAVRDSSSNARYTNRVVSKDGNIVDVNGQLDQLVREGVPIRDKRVILSQANVVCLKGGA